MSVMYKEEITENLPTISIVIPTYNCAGVLKNTLESLDTQDYPKDRIERIIVDGGSTDDTRNIAQSHGFRIVDNPVRSNLYGLPLGFNAAMGDLVLHIDDDNVLDVHDWLRKMVEPFQDNDVVAAEPLFYTASREENVITRYVSLLGADDPLVVYAGFHDKYSALTNTWTGVPHHDEEYEHYFTVTFPKSTWIPSLACNAFLARRTSLQQAVKTPWLHMDGAVRMLRQPGSKWAKVRVGIINHHAPGVIAFWQKKSRRMRTRSKEASSFEYRYPLSWSAIVYIVVRSFLVLPLVVDTVRGMRRRKDVAWLLHPILTTGTIVTYILTYLYLRLNTKAPRPTPLRVQEL